MSYEGLEDKKRGEAEKFLTYIIKGHREGFSSTDPEINGLALKYRKAPPEGAKKIRGQVEGIFESLGGNVSELEKKLKK